MTLSFSTRIACTTFEVLSAMTSVVSSFSKPQTRNVSCSSACKRRSTHPRREASVRSATELPNPFALLSGAGMRDAALDAVAGRSLSMITLSPSIVAGAARSGISNCSAKFVTELRVLTSSKIEPRHYTTPGASPKHRPPFRKLIFRALHDHRAFPAPRYAVSAQ